MTNSQRLAIVRACLQRWLLEHDDSDANGNPILRESILIRNEFYCVRQFHARNHHAVWFIEEDQLKIYDADRNVVTVFSNQEIDATAKSEPTILKLPERDDDGEIRRAA